MKKIFSILFSIAFILVFVSFFSQKTLAASCTYTGKSTNSVTLTAVNDATNLAEFVCITSLERIGITASTATSTCNTAGANNKNNVAWNGCTTNTNFLADDTSTCTANITVDCTPPPTCQQLATKWSLSGYSCLSFDKCDSSVSYFSPGGASDCGSNFCCKPKSATVTTTTSGLKTDTCTPAGGSCTSPTATSCSAAFPGSTLYSGKTCPVSGQMCCKTGSGITTGAGTTGVCSATHWQCATGNPGGLDDTPPDWNWYCTGSNGVNVPCATPITGGGSCTTAAFCADSHSHCGSCTSDSQCGGSWCSSNTTTTQETETCVSGCCAITAAQANSPSCTGGGGTTCAPSTGTCQYLFPESCSSTGKQDITTCTNGVSTTTYDNPCQISGFDPAANACTTGTCNQSTGVCESVCTFPNTQCGSTCTNLTTDLNNCGSCGNTCSTGQTCSSGTCSSNTTCTGTRTNPFYLCSSNTCVLIPVCGTSTGGCTAAGGSCNVQSTCTGTQTNPYYTCSGNTCVSNPVCGTNSGGCTAAGGICNVQSGDTTLTFTIGLDGIGHTGDNVNADWTAHVQAATQFTQANTSGSNQTPKTLTRPLSVKLFDKDNKETDYTGTMTYDSTSGLFNATIDLGANFITGSYSVKVSTDGHLVRLVPGPLQTITAATTNPMPRANLVAGDIESDNALNIQDYNILMSCIHDSTINNPDNGKLCAQDANYSKRSDFYDNGAIDNRDYNLFLREYSVQNGD